MLRLRKVEKRKTKTTKANSRPYYSAREKGYNLDHPSLVLGSRKMDGKKVIVEREDKPIRCDVLRASVES